MPSSFKEGVKSVLQINKASRRLSQDGNLSDFSSKSIAESAASWPPPVLKQRSHVAGFKNVFGSCFAPSTAQEEDQDVYFHDISVSSSSSTLSSAGGLYPTANEDRNSGLLVFTMAELIRATNNFSPSLKIGQGGFSTVYKGKLRDGRFVAIKRAKKNANDVHISAEFHNELATLSSIEHMNLVKFIGYAEQGPERILVVEYVSNGNLREHLDGMHGKVLDLPTRLDIAIDIAHAITYLHLYADRSIIHRDIKSSNILLTENFRAKVADFGFSKLTPTDFEATHVSTQVKGTAGYLDPEYLKTYQLTQKSDVYSFGVVLVELFTGRRPIEQKREAKERITTRWAFQMFLDGKVTEILDPKLERSPSLTMMAERVLELAFRCAAPSRQERPSMKKTAEALWNIRKEYQTRCKDLPILSTSDSERL